MDRGGVVPQEAEAEEEEEAATPKWLTLPVRRGAQWGNRALLAALVLECGQGVSRQG